jgi:hypothetical protein
LDSTFVNDGYIGCDFSFSFFNATASNDYGAKISSLLRRLRPNIGANKNKRKKQKKRPGNLFHFFSLKMRWLKRGSQKIFFD